MHSNHPDRKARARSFSAKVRLGLVALVSVVGAGLGASACLDRPLCDVDCRPRTTNIFVDTIDQTAVDKIDLLFMIDNSISMADKQAVLKDAVPDLVNRLVSPNCVDANGKPDKANTPDNPDANCPSGETREFNAIKNIHIGVITSSIGGHGSSLCQGNDNGTLTQQEENDHAHLIATRPRFAQEKGKPEYAGGENPDPQGFLDWNPTTHPNQKSGGSGAFVTTFKAMVTASSEFGCGLESQLEAVYRFLVDPAPPDHIGQQNCPGTNQPCAVPVGNDAALLAQRAAFLRPDSLVAVIMVTDENDCSIIEQKQWFYPARDTITLPPASSQCATNPNDKCCHSCASPPQDGCPPNDQDPSCQKSNTPAWAKSDALNLRCYEQKRRFGVDFLYPTARYVNALSQTRLCTSRADLAVDPTNPGACPDLNGDGQPDIASNPLFNDISGATAIPRAQSLVFLAGIVGVPYQDILATADKDGNPYPANELHYKTAASLKSENIWGQILGDPFPAAPAGGGAVPAPSPPTNALMIESTAPRGGNDGQGNALAPPGAGPMANPVNGHEWGITAGDDLEYACIFKLETPRNCDDVSKLPEPQPGCDCKPPLTPNDNNPLCQDANGQYGTNQIYAKGYPGIRELQVLKDFGDNSIVASICARNLTDKLAQDYGYRPAVDAIIDRLKEALTGRCLPRQLSVDPKSGSVPCSIIEVRPASASSNCATPGRRDPKTQVIQPVMARLEEQGVCSKAGGGGLPACNQFHLCELQEAVKTCHQDVTQEEAGWCYIDPAKNPNDSPSLVANCPASEQRILRFVDPENNTPAHDAKVLIACFGADLGDDTGSTAMK